MEFALGAIVGSFLIPALVFFLFFNSAGKSKRSLLWLVAGWAFGLLLIYASTIPAGRGFVAGLTWGHLGAVIYGLWLTARALKYQRTAV